MANLFKKSQGQDSSDAAVSSIPVPPSDSALVIDLPEGQKLVLGKIEEGTVIEVATWRGTGRPDSRTNRLMLGVSFGGSSGESKPAEVSNDKSSYLDVLKSKVSEFLTILVSKIRSNYSKTKSSLQSRKVSRRESKKLPYQAIANEVSSQSMIDDEFDIDKWLNTVRSNSRVSKLSTLEKTPSRKAVRGTRSAVKGSKGANLKSNQGRRGTKSTKKA